MLLFYTLTAILIARSAFFPKTPAQRARNDGLRIVDTLSLDLHQINFYDKLYKNYRE
jgi:hypothetical protein